MSNKPNQKTVFKAFRSQLMTFQSPLTDHQYQSVRTKPNPSIEELSFIDAYQNVYLMQGLSLLIAAPAIYYLRKSTKYRLGLARCDPQFTLNQYQKLRNKMTFYLSFGLACVLSTELYSYHSGLYEKINQVRTTLT